MEIRSATIEPVTMSDILNLATWNRARSSEELQHYIQTRHENLPDNTEIE